MPAELELVAVAYGFVEDDYCLGAALQVCEGQVAEFCPNAVGLVTAVLTCCSVGADTYAAAAKEFEGDFVARNVYRCIIVASAR